jgi:hypothetical protein
VTPEDARKLIGGYATGNLGDAERKALFAAALSEQELFDELVKEQALKELLDDPESRRRLMDQLQRSPERLSGMAAWRWAAAGSLALATVMIAVVMMSVPDKPNAAPVLTATRLPAPAPPMAAPVAPPAEALRDSFQDQAREAPPPARSKLNAPQPAIALSEPVDSLMKSKMTNQVAADSMAGLRYRILRRDASGAFSEAADETVFVADDAVRLRVETPAAGILSLSSGGELLASLPVAANQSYVLPADRPITLDAGAGETRLTLTLSARADRLEAREKKAEAAAGAISTAAPQDRRAFSVEIVLRRR